MKHSTTRAAARVAGRARTSMNIDRRKLSRVREILATRTDTEAVDRALELVISNAEIAATLDQVFGALPGFSVT